MEKAMSLVVLLAVASSGVCAATDVKPAAYRVLPAGAVRPCGWLLRQLELQRDGLTGHAEELYPDIGLSDWLTGAHRGGDFAWERGPYYAKGLLALAFVLDDAALKGKAKHWAEAYLVSQRPDGDFGPKNRNWWANMPALHFMRDWCDATGDARALGFLKRYAAFQLAELPRHPLVKDSYWARARGGDNAEVALWLFDRTHDADYLKLARLLAEQTADWTGYYTVGGNGDYGDGYRMHIVNFMQGLKAPALAWRLFGREADRAAYAAACGAEGWPMRAHGRPDRMLNGTEPLSGRSPAQATELCAIAERILSCRDVVAASGDPLAADDLEFVAYNALPAALSRDGKGLRYYLSLNQPQCVTGRKFGYENNGESAAQCPGPDAGYGCCRSNFHFAWPKFVQSAWMETPEGGLAAVVYADCRVETKRATIRESGSYPRGGHVTFDVEKADGSTWELVLRKPLWCPRLTVSVNGSPASGTSVRRAWRAGDRVEVTLEMPPARVACAEGTVAWTRGPLVYAFPVPEKAKALPTAANRTGFPVVELRAAGPWNWALADAGPVAVRDGAMAFRAALTSWGGWGTYRAGGVHYDARPIDPVSPVPASAPRGPFETLELVPLADTQLRITCFPVLAEGH